MPFSWESKYKIPRDKDHRVKLSLEDREDIKKLYASGDYSYNTLAKKYNVSKRLILFICNPDSKKREYARRRERIARGEYQQYSSEMGAEYMRRHRAYKKSLIEKGKAIKEQPDD